MAQDPRIDAYIAKAPAFARTILTHLRALVHATIAQAGEWIAEGKKRNWKYENC